MKTPSAAMMNTAEIENCCGIDLANNADEVHKTIQNVGPIRAFEGQQQCNRRLHE